MAHRVISLRYGIWSLSEHSGLWRAVRPADLWVHGLASKAGFGFKRRLKEICHRLPRRYRSSRSP